MDMFCYQCEQTKGGEGCVKRGVCGKDPETAALQDLLLYATKGIANWAHRARQLGVVDRDLDVFVVEALFTTVTNVNFDPDRLETQVRDAAKLLGKAKERYQQASKDKGQDPENLAGPATWEPANDRAGLLTQAAGIGLAQRMGAGDATVVGLQELITYGLKGAAAYADHAHVLGEDDDGVYAFFLEALDFLTAEQSVDDLVGMALRVGEVNIRVMELLDAANTGTYGHPEPTKVRVTPKKGKAILVSGHDLKDLAALLEQTQGKGINVYTHGEMLPTLAYPALKKHDHLAGHYGTAWQNQKEEFAKFPGAILMTTNCIQKPADSYSGRLFTSGLVAWPGVEHIADQDFSKVIAAAEAAEGFAEDGPDETITVGFGREAVLGVADKVIAAVKEGSIKHFFLVGGCDGAKPGRNYYTEFAQAVPKDSVILTLACGKFRFNRLQFGDIGGIPRLLDVGQCNDAYSAVRIAMALAEAFDTDVNGLPLSLVLSWYEQKAVAILLSLLHLGVKDIRLGPSLPAFVTEPVLNVLVDKFAIAPTTTVEADMQAMLA